MSSNWEKLGYSFWNSKCINLVFGKQKELADTVISMFIYKGLSLNIKKTGKKNSRW